MRQGCNGQQLAQIIYSPLKLLWYLSISSLTSLQDSENPLKETYERLLQQKSQIIM